MTVTAVQPSSAVRRRGARLDRPSPERAAHAQRMLALTSTAGWCTGGCGAEVPHRYGPNAQLMCEHCAGRMKEWRARPAASRGPLVYGRMVDGVYRLPEGST